MSREAMLSVYTKLILKLNGGKFLLGFLSFDVFINLVSTDLMNIRAKE
uniref:Uncharacterized protein n=1 Tax=Oryzias melastigma TaxID=30732 RepID=A0A3B3BDX3_ORYME